jgi:hypothetical protein
MQKYTDLIKGARGNAVTSVFSYVESLNCTSFAQKNIAENSQ